MNKVLVQEEATDLIRSVTDGIEDPLEMYIVIKKIEAIIKIAKDQIGVKAYRDTTISPGEEEIAYGCKIEKVTSGTKYVWEDVLDPVYWQRKSELKEREDFLKGLKSTSMMTDEERNRYIEDNDLEYVDEETGEVIIINPVVKVQGVGLKITIK